MPLFWLKDYEKCTLATAALANNVESALLEIYLLKRVKISQIRCACSINQHYPNLNIPFKLFLTNHSRAY